MRNTNQSWGFQQQPNSRGSNFNPSFEMDQLTVWYSSNFLVEAKYRKQSFISRKKRKFDANKLFVIFQVRTGLNYINVKAKLACTKLSEKFPEQLYFTPPYRTVVHGEITEKHRLLNIWKKYLSELAHTKFKYQRNLFIRRLKTTQTECC